MNVKQLREKLRGLDDNLLVIIEDTAEFYEENEERDGFTLTSTHVIELYPGTDALMLRADPKEM